MATYRAPIGGAKVNRRRRAHKFAIEQVVVELLHQLRLSLDSRAHAYRRREALAKELVALQPDVILAQTTPIVAALQRESRGLPIVFVYVSDPVGFGFVESLARPGGNLTGL